MTTILKPDHGVFGLPPSMGTYISNQKVRNSMPVVNIIPCKPEMSTGLTAFTVSEDWNTYNNILENAGYKLSDKNINIAFIADSFPTDTFTNEYGETFLQKMTDVASSGMSQLSQMSNSNNAIELIKNLSGHLSGVGKSVDGMIGTALGTAGNIGAGVGNALQSVRNAAAKQNSTLGAGADLVNTMIAGHRVDFPQLWQNSGFAPSYTLTCRLFNPSPKSLASTKHYIIGPLAVILALGVPRSIDGSSYKWPFLHKVRCPGIYDLSPAAITNIAVIKGGDQQQIGDNQRLGMVDVRIDFISLFNSILADEGKRKQANRPTLKTYLQAMEREKEIRDPYYHAQTMSGDYYSNINPELIKPRRSVYPVSTNPKLIPNNSRGSQVTTGSSTVTDRSAQDAKDMETLLTQSNSTLYV